MGLSSDEDYYWVLDDSNALLLNDVLGGPIDPFRTYCYEPMEFGIDSISQSSCSDTGCLDYSTWSLPYSEHDNYPGICDVESPFDPLGHFVSFNPQSPDEPEPLLALTGRRGEDSGFESPEAGSPQDPRETIEPQQRCHFIGCRSGPFETTFDFRVHLKQHSEKICDNSVARPGRCQWPRCSSKAVFKTRTQLQTHLDNIHVNPLLCTEAGCTYKTPFRSNYDLKRHIKTIHYGKRESQYACPYADCQAAINTFARKDKWLNHLRTSHVFDENPRCPLNHCSVGVDDGIASQHELVKHIMKCHGSSSYECAIGSCARQAASRFDELMLYRHLESCHRMQARDIAAARNAASLENDRTVRVAQLPAPTSYTDCRLCR